MRRLTVTAVVRVDADTTADARVLVEREIQPVYPDVVVDINDVEDEGEVEDDARARGDAGTGDAGAAGEA